MAESTFTPGPWRAVRSDPAQGADCWWICAGEGNQEKELATVAGGYPQDRHAANARLIAQSPRFADIAARAQYLANERDGDYSSLTKDELCAFMAEFDEALSDARGEP